MEVRRFDQAEEKALEALEKLNVILVKVPQKVDYRLLRTRAYLTLFMARNILVIENAKIRPRSLVRIPEVYEYKDYDSTIVPAEEELKEIINTIPDLTLEQQGYAHGMLGVIFRLNADTANEADQQYQRAIGAYEGWLREMKRDKPLIGTNQFNINKLENQVRGLIMARAEVSMLAEKWPQALELLEKVMAGQDLKYFEIQFPFYERQIAEMQRKLDTDDTGLFVTIASINGNSWKKHAVFYVSITQSLIWKSKSCSKVSRDRINIYS